MSFIIIAAAMLLAALGFIAVPLLRKRHGSARGSSDANRDVHLARLAELRADVAAGQLDPADFAAARHDLETDFDRNAASAAQPAAHGRAWLSAVAAAVLIPCAAGVLYLQLGSWQSALYGDDSLPAMIANTRARLAKAPDQIAGWEFLGEAYSAKRRYGAAAMAYQRALALSDGKNADLLAAYGEARILSHPQHFDPALGKLFNRVLKLDPGNPRGLWYGGMTALHDGDKDIAVRRFQQLLTQNPPPPIRRVLVTQIKAAGGKVPAVATASQKGQRAVAGAATIAVQVGVAPKLAAKVPADATLYVFVRPAGDEGGPPLAVRRLQVGHFPVEVRLSDADAMIPGRHLASYKQLRVVARISRSGQPLQRSGDIYGSADFSWQAGAGGLKLVLNQIVTQ